MNVVIVASKADVPIMRHTVGDLIRIMKTDRICVITSVSEIDDSVKTDLDRISNKSIDWLEEDTIYPGLSFDSVKDEITQVLGYEPVKSRIGWYFQQFLKMAYSYYMEEDEYFQIDADVLVLKELPVIGKDGKPVFITRTEYNKPYFDTIKVLFGLEKQTEKSFISETMYFKTSIMREIIEKISSNDAIDGDCFWKKIIHAIEPKAIEGSGFSEYETYGTYVSAFYPGLYDAITVPSLRDGKRLLGVDAGSEVKEWASGSYYYAGLEKWDRESPALIKLNNSPVFRSICSAKTEAFTVRNIRRVTDFINQHHRFSIRLAAGRIINRMKNRYRYIRGSVCYREEDAKTDIVGTDRCMVLIHTGTRPIPDYIVDCLEQIRLFSNLPVFVIYSRSKVLSDNICKMCDVVYLEDIPISKEHIEFYKRLASHRSMFDNFFQAALERFFVLHEAMHYLQLKNVIHMENDILLYEDAEVLIDRMKGFYSDISVPRMNENACMASVMFVPDEDKLKGFLEYILDHIYDRGANDMNLLARYMIEKGHPAMPVATETYVKKYGLSDKKGNKPDKDRENDYWIGSEELGGIMDAAPLGQFIGGIDKVHTGGESSVGFINDAAMIDSSKMEIRWKQEERGLIPYSNTGDEECRILNLHIHSKELKKYRSDRV